MSKPLTIILSNPDNDIKEMSLFGIDDFEGKTGTQKEISNLIDTGTHYVVGSVGQSWLLNEDAELNSVSLKFVNYSSSAYPQRQATLSIYEVDSSDNLTNFITSKQITLPALNPGDTLVSEFIISANLQAGKYAFQIQKNNPADADIDVATDSGGNYTDGISYPNGVKNSVYDLFFSVKLTVNNTSDDNIKVANSSYAELVKTLRMSPQPYNYIKIISDDFSQRIKLIDVINRDILGNETVTNALQSASFVSNKDTGNVTEIKLDKPLLLGKDEIRYILNPNTDVTIIFDNIKPVAKTEINIDKPKKTLDKIKDTKLIQTFIKKEKEEQALIIIVTISVILFLFRQLIKIIK